MPDNFIELLEPSFLNEVRTALLERAQRLTRRSQSKDDFVAQIAKFDLAITEATLRAFA